MVEKIKVESPKIRTEHKNILRWEEDGGRIVEADSSETLEQPLIQPIRSASRNQSWFRRFPKKEDPDGQKSRSVAQSQ